MKKNYLRWSEIAYPGETNPPTNPVTPLAGTWPLFYLKRNEKGELLDQSGKKIEIPIKSPNRIDFNKELPIVQKTLQNLTTHQKNIGEYYGTGVPTKQWTPIIDRLIDTYDVSPTYAARILATIQSAINDTMLVVWNLKYRWDVARPNQYDPALKPLLCMPIFPTYPSGHASMSGCSEVILSYFFPKESKKLKKIAEDDARSRLFAGVHFPIDNEEGLKLGRYIGEIIVNHLKAQTDQTLNPVDTPYREYRDASILPDESYEQVISFDFPDKCHSDIGLSESKNMDMKKPMLFI